jgi:hypothetical protein
MVAKPLTKDEARWIAAKLTKAAALVDRGYARTAMIATVGQPGRGDGEMNYDYLTILVVITAVATFALWRNSNRPKFKQLNKKIPQGIVGKATPLSRSTTDQSSSRTAASLPNGRPNSFTSLTILPM